MKLLFILTLTLASTSFVSAQNKDKWKFFPSDEDTITKDTVDTNSEQLVKKDSNRIGYVEIIQDERIKNLLEKEIRINEKDKTIDGFRIQLFSGSGANVKNEANETKSLFIKHHENVPAYVYYDDPVWKTRVGDFRTKLDAEKFLMEIQEIFPNSFVVSDRINFPKKSSKE